MSEILIMSNTYVPYGFLAANGSTLAVNQNQALFALMGVTFGGSAQTNFMIPDLCGRIPVGMGLSQRDRIYNYTEGEYGGAASTTITSNQLPAHTHTATFTPTGTVPTPISVSVGVSTDATGTTAVASPKNNVIARGFDSSSNALNNFSKGGVTADTYLGGVTVSGGGGITGGTVTNNVSGLSQPFSLMQPYVVINYVLCVSGVFPTHQ